MHSYRISEENIMSSEFNELLSSYGSSHSDERTPIWVVGTREQVEHFMNELYVKGVVSDRAHFSPIVPAPFASGKYLVIVAR
jgi:hypothetical protein